MAKFVKSERELPDIDLELAKVSKKETKEKKKETDKKKSNKKDKNSNKKDKSKKSSYFKEVRKELSKVVWPSKKNMVKYSIAVIAFILFFSVFFYVIELIMALLEAGV